MFLVEWKANFLAGQFAGSPGTASKKKTVEKKFRK
jgi:hypothetical protein